MRWQNSLLVGHNSTERSYTGSLPLWHSWRLLGFQWIFSVPRVLTAILRFASQVASTTTLCLLDVLSCSRQLTAKNWARQIPKAHSFRPATERMSQFYNYDAPLGVYSVLVSIFSRKIEILVTNSEGVKQSRRSVNGTVASDNDDMLRLSGG